MAASPHANLLYAGAIGLWALFSLVLGNAQQAEVSSARTLDRAALDRIEPLSLERERLIKAGDSFRECDACPEMVVLPPGGCLMGSPDSDGGGSPNEGPRHAIAIAQAFAVGRFHVTVEQYSAFVSATGYQGGSRCWTFEGGMDAERPGRSWRNPGFAQLGSHPAVCLSWVDAKTYVDWLATLTGRGYRMLSEAEWEYAARGETAANSYKRYWFGDDEKDLCLNANGADQTTRESIQEAAGWTVAPCNDLYAYSSPVGSFTPNGFGLYDMHGNAWQWTEDCYHETYAGAPVDGSAWVTGDCSRRVLRGGSWVDDPKSLRAAFRDWDPSGDRYFSYGIRVARTLIR